jgi:hypothetical protein
LRKAGKYILNICCYSVFLLVFNFIMSYDVVQASELVYKEKIVSDINKAWKINFTNDLDFDTVNDKTIRILDDKNTLVGIKISRGDSLKECVIEPLKPYVNKGVYTIYISEEIKSTNGRPLKNSIKMNFKVDTTASQTYKGTAKVQLGVISSFKTITIDSCNLPEVKKFRIQESTKILNLGEELRAVIPSDTTTIYFYSKDEKLLGSATISIKNNNSNLTFDIIQETQQ